MLDRYFSDKINKFLSIGLKIYGSSEIDKILKVVEYEDIIQCVVKPLASAMGI